MLNRSNARALAIIAAVACGAMLANGQNQTTKPDTTTPAKPAAGVKVGAEKAVTNLEKPAPAESAGDADEQAVRDSVEAFTPTTPKAWQRCSP